MKLFLSMLFLDLGMTLMVWLAPIVYFTMDTKMAFTHNPYAPTILCLTGLVVSLVSSALYITTEHYKETWE